MRMWQTFAFLFRSAKCPLCYHGIVFDVCFHPRVRNAQPVAQTQNSELIYRLEDRRRFLKPCLPPVSICWRCSLRDHASAINLPGAGFTGTRHATIISMSLFASGVASIIQIKAWVRLAPGCCLFRVPASTLLPADYGRYRAENRWC